MTNLMKWTGLALVVLGLMTVTGGRAEAGLVVDVTTDDNGVNSVLGTLNLTTGQYTQGATLSMLVGSLTTGTNGTLYAGATNGNLYTISGSGVASQFGSVSASVPPGGNQIGFLGLAYAGANGFYATNLNADTFTGSYPGTLAQISADGNGISTVGTLGPQLYGYSSGDLSYGPDGSLYFLSFDANANPELFRVDTTTGVATEVGSGLGVANDEGLTLVNAGGQLYGIDTFQPSGSGPIKIYTIDTTTGLATDTGVTVSGLDAGFTIDTAAATVPEPSSIVLLGIGTIAVALRIARRKGLGAAVASVA